MKQLFLQMKWVQTILQWWMNKKWREAVHYINGPETVSYTHLLISLRPIASQIGCPG